MTQCQHCRDNLIDYVNNEASPRVRRRVAAHLRTCEACYATYVRERDAAQHITQELTLFGTPPQGSLDSLWSSIQSEIDTPTTPRAQSSGWQHGLALVALAVLVALPWSLNFNELVSGTAMRATPVVMPNGTPEGTHIGSVRVVALDTTGKPTEDVLPPTPTSTPAIAPIPGASDLE